MFVFLSSVGLKIFVPRLLDKEVCRGIMFRCSSFDYDGIMFLFSMFSLVSKGVSWNPLKIR